MPKQLYTNAGIYLRLSREDAREGESLSIENQRLILTEHVKKQGWNIGDIYVDDGVSGTTLDRPAMNKLVEDCRSGKINIIVVKDMSRLGRDYIGVGNLIEEMVSRNVRIVAVNDGIDTADMDSSQMQMLPFVNIFNECHYGCGDRR